MNESSQELFVFDEAEPTTLRDFKTPANLESELETMSFKTRRTKAEVFRDLIIIGLNAEIMDKRGERVEPVNTLPPDLLKGDLMPLGTRFPIGLDQRLYDLAQKENTSKNEVILRLIYKGLEYTTLSVSKLYDA